MRRPFSRAGPEVFLVLFALALFGCGEEEDSTPVDRRSLDEIRKAREQAEQERRRTQQLREQDRRVLEAQRREAESDASAAVLLWATTAVSLAVVIVLLARERRLRRILERLLRMLLGQNRERGP
ncbi:MAG: hypothetical protein WBF17_24845 [Phycisphaerae bacterium]